MNITNNFTENGLYHTSDLALATTLTLSSPIEQIDKTDPRRVVFTFKRTSELGSTIEAYWRGELRVEPQKFFGQLKIIKSRLYEERL